MTLSTIIIKWLKEKFKCHKFVSHKYGIESIAVYSGELIVMIINDKSVVVLTGNGRIYATDRKLFTKLEKEVKSFLKFYNDNLEYML